MRAEQTAQELILAAMAREGITWDQVAERVARDEKICRSAANLLVDVARDGYLFSVAIAAAIITLLADKRRTPQCTSYH